MPQPSSIAIRQEWHAAWQVPKFRQRLILGIALVVSLLSIFPYFFNWVEKRQGVLLNDRVLSVLPPHNVSVPLFILIWSLSLLGIVRAVQFPRFLLTFVWSFFLLSLFRVLTITLVPLDPPANLLNLADPLSNFFYGHDRFITKDLFFSGHTSTMFLLFLCFTGRGDRKIALIVTCFVAFLLLVQHVHYTVDIVGGFIFGWISWSLGSRIAGKD
ncbi:MAG TPA: phosphatase PAP2-related protein [Puia sp.]|nr:phosphatase PAP2-related protein [Puia sp.]